MPPMGICAYFTL